MDHFTASFNVSHRQAELHKDASLIRAGRKAGKSPFIVGLRGLWPFKSRPAVTEPMATDGPITEPVSLPIADDGAGSTAKAA